MVADAPPFAAVADETLRRLEGQLLVAHNARFDFGFSKANSRASESASARRSCAR